MIGGRELTVVRRWLASPIAQRVIALLGTAMMIVLAGNPNLLPLLPVVDALEPDVIA